MRLVLKNFVSLPVVLCSLFLLAFVTTAHSQVYSSVMNGNWTAPSTWAGGNVPPTDVPAGATININHVVNYNFPTTNLNNSGTIRLERIAGPAQLNVPTNIDVLNLPGASFYIINAVYLQCRFIACNNGQPYSGNNSSTLKNSGNFKSTGARVEIRGSYMEVAQDWTNESGAFRIIIDSCVLTGQNFSVTASTNEHIRSFISVGWHGSGNIDFNNSQITFDRMTYQLAGVSGNFKLDSSTRAGGDIDIITLRNQFGNGGAGFTGSGEINADPSLKNLANQNTSGIINLDTYCVSSPSKFIDVGNKFIGETPSCSGNVACGTTGSTAGEVSVEGRVTDASGRGIRNAIVTVSGGDLDQPIITRTGPFGYYSVKDLDAGKTYSISVAAKRYRFTNSTRVVSLDDSLTDMDFVADGPNLFVKPASRKN